MIKPLIALTAAAMSLSASTATYEEIRDESGLSWKNPDLKERKSAKIRLPNGLEVFLISDPAADQSSAAAAVEVGSWSDPPEYPGMAHFCEHLLFLGSQKYPDPKEFTQFLSDHGGTRNAYTGSDRTVYMFSCQTEPFLDALDRFSRFFIDPQFEESDIARELHAVDQEFAKNLENDGWRIHMVSKELSNPAHPETQFNIGNSETLSKIPRTVFRAWHQEHYRAGRIRLFIYSSLPLQQLKDAISEFFAEVPSGAENPLLVPKHLKRAEREGKMTYIEPIQDISHLKLSWELPGAFLRDETGSAKLVAEILKRGQDKGLYELLQNAKLIDHLQIEVAEVGSKHVLFEIAFQLTPQGLKNKEQVVTHCFEAIAGLKEKKIPAYLFDEWNSNSKRSFEYQERIDAYKMAKSIGSGLLDEPLSTFPRKSILASHFDPKKVSHLLSCLTPEKCHYTLSAPSQTVGILPDKRERWFGAEYALKEIPENQLIAWQNVLPNPQIELPGPNPFFATNLTLADTQDHAKTPIRLFDGEEGTVYYYRGAEFSAPFSSFHLQLASPFLTSSAESWVLTSLYLDHITDLLRPVLAAAKSAGLYSGFRFDRLKLHIQIDGFDEKAPLLLDEILREMTHYPPTPEQFELYHTRHEKAFRNAEKALPVSQSKQLLNSLLFEGQITDQAKKKALENITYSDFLHFYENLFKQTHAEAVFAGNFTRLDAEKIWLDIQKRLPLGGYPKQEQHILQCLYDTDRPQLLQKSCSTQGSGVTLAIDQGELTLERKSVQQILDPILSEAFFHELRTKQKTGYLVDAYSTEFENHLYQYFLVQSNSYTPKELLYRFEHFLEEFLETLEQEIPSNRFERIRNAAIQQLENRFRNLSEKNALWNLLAFQKGGDFDYVQKRIQALKSIRRERVFEIAREMFARSNKKRLAVLSRGKMEDPFDYSVLPNP